MSETAEPRVVRVDSVGGALLLNTRFTANDAIIPSEFFSAREWVFDDADLGLRLGRLCCPPKLELRQTAGAGVGVFARVDIKAGEEVRAPVSANL